MENILDDREAIDAQPPITPSARLIWTAVVDVDDRIDLGNTPEGHRFRVPILGGNFFAGLVDDGLEGEVLVGGADNQLLRPDGVKELYAEYEMKTLDGTILPIRNRVIVDENRQPKRYAMSVISVSAPKGRFDWLNRRLILGTLQTLRPERQAVVIRAWEADALS